jgi:methyl-accepting chemotaxis protein
LVEEITAASKEQDTGAEQINKALQQLEQVIQQNASASEEMASTTEELTGQSDQLVSALAFFRTRDNSHAPSRKFADGKPAKLAGIGSEKTSKPNGHSSASEVRMGEKSGVSLRLQDQHDDHDGEFERY